MNTDAKEIMRIMLHSFIVDPPDNDFQRGFLEGLVVFAHEGLRMRPEDQTFKEASDIAYDKIVGPAPKRRPFQVIKGGKFEDDKSTLT